MRMLIKRFTIALYDFTALLVVAFIASFAFTQVAWAYVDPSVMTYTIQALAGVAVALSAVAGVAFRRGRKHLYKLLDIDENAKKQFEPAINALCQSKTKTRLSPRAFLPSRAKPRSIPQRFLKRASI